MGKENMTSWTEFVLAGLLHQKSPTVFLGVVLFVFFIALVGNSLLLFLIKRDAGLQTPMYHFLSHLAFMDLCQILATVPQMTVSFAAQRYTITLYQCAMQIFISGSVGTAECLILSIMSYDRYVAICRPLQYPVLMRRSVCYAMSGGVWFGACLVALTCSLYVLPLPYCKSNVIDHIICEHMALIQLSCSDNSAFQRAAYVGSFLVLLFPILVILASYMAILLQVLRLRSSGGNRKALGTCFAHLCVVGIFYITAMMTFMTPISAYSAEKAMINSLCITIVPPLINPFIYSLRNRDVLAALRKLSAKCTWHK